MIVQALQECSPEDFSEGFVVGFILAALFAIGLALAVAWAMDGDDTEGPDEPLEPPRTMPV